MRMIACCIGLVFSAAASARADDGAGAESTEVAVTATAADAGNARRRTEIERSLVELDDEEGATPRLWPILTIALGATAVLAAATSGAVAAISCDDSCSTGAWQGPSVVGGSAVATLGILWLRWTDADLREIELRRRSLETERDRLESAAAERANARSTEAHVALAVRGTF